MISQGSAVRVILYLGAAICGTLLVLQGVKVETSWLRSLNIAVGAVTVLVWMFDRYAWRAPLVRRAVPRRLLRGTWRGTLISDWTEPDTGDGLEPIKVYLAVDQTYSDVMASLMTSESKSQSIVATLDDPSRGQCLLSAIYINTPELLRQDQSRIHRGGLVLEVSGKPADRLSGSYWTDRGTRGQLTLTGHTPTIHDSFAAAERGTFSGDD